MSTCFPERVRYGDLAMSINKIMPWPCRPLTRKVGHAGIHLALLSPSPIAAAWFGLSAVITHADYINTVQNYNPLRYRKQLIHRHFMVRFFDDPMCDHTAQEA